jgi:putative sigma-54 modulation protein
MFNGPIPGPAARRRPAGGTAEDGRRRPVVEIAFVGSTKTVPEPVRQVAVAKLAHLGRMAPVLERAEVRFSRDSALPGAASNVCEVVMTGHGHTVRARATGRDEPASIDLVVAKLEHQVERLKGRLVDRSQPRRSRR